MNRKNIKIIAIWLLVILFEVLIFYFSNMNTYDSNSKSKNIMSSVIDTVMIMKEKLGLIDEVPNEKEKQILIEKLNPPFRKCIHFGTYFILAILIVKALNLSAQETSSKVFWTIIICFLLAILDEYHQTFIYGRTGSFKDVLIDTVGSIMGIYIYKKTLGVKALSKTQKLKRGI